jgi:hypothetical protein
MSKKVNIEMSEEDIRELLIPLLLVREPEQFATLLLGHVKTDIGLIQIYRALQNLYPVLKYKVGDAIYVRLEYLATWRYDKTATYDLPGTLEGTYIPCQIISCDAYSASPYTVEYTVKREGKTDAEKDSYAIAESLIYKKIEDFAAVLDEIEQANQTNN